MDNIAWQPQARQLAFMSRPEYEVLYGGAAGGGKSDALIVEALRQVHIPHYKGLILRKTFPQLEELISRSLRIYPVAVEGCRYNGQAHCWRFPSGAMIYFGSMPHSKDRFNYQGKAYDFIAFDELTHFTWEEYSYLFSRNRPTGEGTRVYIRASANPGGIGHGWVKERFISPAPPGTVMRERLKVKDDQGREREMIRDRVFIPSTVFDNPALLANDPAHYEDRQWTHVVSPFDIPRHWRIWRSFDFGYSRPFSVGWYTADEAGKIYRIKEYYGCTGAPNVGVKLDPASIAREIRQLEQDDPRLKNRQINGVADPAIFDRQRGDSVADIMAREGVYWGPGDHTRLAGKMQMHYRLAFDQNGIPMFQVFDTCKHFIRTIPALVYDEAKPEDIDTDGEDHIYDECRYLLMQHPISPREHIPYNRPAFDPLDLGQNDQRRAPASVAIKIR